MNAQSSGHGFRSLVSAVATGDPEAGAALGAARRSPVPCRTRRPASAHRAAGSGNTPWG
ncbi:hypothetical protein [Sphaerisporangium dianthi]|uniref:Uncharacterized protein n=1 Tax=Sphaerisporangium dianthi TaxID=1436120 RepID=A0ABV9CSB6_9ACTN